MLIYKLAKGGNEPLLHSIQRVEEFLRYLEVVCVADCCGLDAFRFNREDIEHAYNQLGDACIKDDIQQITTSIQKTEAQIIYFPIFNQTLQKDEIVELFTSINLFLSVNLELSIDS